MNDIEIGKNKFNPVKVSLAFILFIDIFDFPVIQGSKQSRKLIHVVLAMDDQNGTAEH